MKIGTPKLENFIVGSPNAIKSITIEIIRECNKQKVTVDEDLISYVMSLMSLNPVHGLHLSGRYDRTKLEGFVRACVEKLSDERSPSLKTLMMQTRFMQNPIDGVAIIRENREILDMKSKRLLKDILAAHVITEEDRNKLMKKIAIDVVVANGLGHPLNTKAVAETVNALQSIMSKGDMTKFTSLSSEEKMNSLKDIREIVCGIRVFNRDAGHPSEGVIDLAQFVEQTCESTKSILDINIFEIMDRVNLLTSAIEAAVTTDPHSGHQMLNLPEEVSASDFDLITDILIMSRQQELYIRNLLQHLIHVKNDIDESIAVFRKILQEIHKSVQYKTAIPTEIVFPRFAALGRMWIQIQNQIFILSKINHVNDILSQLAESVPPFENIPYKILDKRPVETDDDRLEKFGGKKFDSQLFEDSNVVEEYRQGVKIEFLGFCVNAIAENGWGILLPGNPNIGIGCYENRNYSSRNIAGLQSFEKNPGRIVHGLIETARRKPELIIFLEIFDQMHACQEICVGSDIFPEEIAVKCEAGVQTDLHPETLGKDKNYTWNMWELRKKAIQLADLRKCRTRSAQTEPLGVMSQTFTVKANETQTMESKCVGE